MSERYPLWGFKDPRTLFVLDEWHRQVPHLERVGIYRHPASVHRSLNKRSDDFTEAQAVELWRSSNERLLDEYDREPFPIIRFDVDPASLSASLASVAAYLHLDVPEQAHGFYDPALVHNADAAQEPIPSDAVEVWNRLQRSAANLPA
jgi:hypothetical protein